MREAPEAGRLDLPPEQRGGLEQGRARGVAPGWQPEVRAALGQVHEPLALDASADSRQEGGLEPRGVPPTRSSPGGSRCQAIRARLP